LARHSTRIRPRLGCKGCERHRLERVLCETGRRANSNYPAMAARLASCRVSRTDLGRLP
jgi:hypothetical protein